MYVYKTRWLRCTEPILWRLMKYNSLRYNYNNEITRVANGHGNLKYGTSYKIWLCGKPAKCMCVYMSRKGNK